MAIIEKFNQLSLARQMQIMFLLSTFAICGVLIVITRLQLDWMRFQVIQKTHKAYSNRIHYQIRSLGLIQAESINSFLENVLNTTLSIEYISKILQGSNSPFVPGKLVNSKDLDNPTFKYTSYYSNTQLSTEGENLIEKQSSISYFNPFLYDSQFTVLSQGFEIDEIIIFYPGNAIKDEEYSPVVHEWYYKSKNSIQAIITDPFYVNDLNLWLITVSKSIYNTDGNFTGVASITFTCSAIVQMIKEMDIYGNGFALLVSRSGTLLNYPDSWKKMMNGKSTLKIYDEKITGIDKDGWNLIKDADDGDENEYSDGNGISYNLFVFKIQPNSIGKVTHYLLICVDEDEINKSRENFQYEFKKTDVTIFWVTFAFSALTFLIIIVTIHFFFLKTCRVLQDIIINIESIFDRALFTDITKNVNFSNKKVKEMKEVAFLFAKKIQDLKNFEENLESNKGLISSEHFIYNDWIDTSYPFNKYNENCYSIKKVLKKLKKFPVMNWNSTKY
jgi:hypothetical protein